MALKRIVAGLIWAAVLLIAVQIVPGSAFAHSGHAHHAGPMADHAGHPHAKASEPTAIEQTIVEAIPAADAVPQAVAPAGCVGGCCGTGIGCCAAALAGSPAALPGPDGAAKILSVTFEARSGIDPEAFARPPRILA